MSDGVDNFLRGEASHGRTISEQATFTLDPKKVRERVAVFSEEESLYPILRCVQAIVRLSRSDIFAQTLGPQQWEFSFRWDDCPPAQAFEQLLNLGTTAGFDHVPTGVEQHLFFGLSAALGTPHYRVTWTGPKANFRLSEGRIELLGETGEDIYCKLSFAVETNWWQRVLGRNPARGMVEELRRRLQYSPRTIHLNQETLRAGAPSAPERPWAAKLSQGSELAWRFLRMEGQNLMTVPYPELDHYKGDKKGTLFHLFREPAERSLPLSVAFSEQKSNRHHLDHALSSQERAHSALFLSLEAGKQDWLIPIRDGVLAEPVAVNVAGGGVVALTADPSLQYDLSGLKVVENDRYEAVLGLLKKESKALKKQLLLSLANIGARAEHLPSQYDQAICYTAGGPYLGMLGGRLMPKVRGFFGKKSR